MGNLQSKMIVKPGLRKRGSKEKGKPGRPLIFTPELRAKLIKLFEEYFFLWIVSAKANIYKQRIIEWKNEQEDFRNDVTHARAEWIKQLSEIRVFIYLSVKNDSKQDQGRKQRRKGKRKGNRTRTTLLTPELSVKLIGLFEEYFFVGIVAAEEGTHRQRIYEWESEQEGFNAPLTHARIR